MEGRDTSPGGSEASRLAYRGAYRPSEVNQRARRWAGSTNHRPEDA